MTIDEAIRVTEEFISVATTEKELYLSQALKLGIEALNRIKFLRNKRSQASFALLPGETTD